jgi:hypothetical protein
VVLESLFKLMEVWWFIIINILKGCYHFESFASDKYFFKTSNCGDKIFSINNRFCDLHAKNILNRYSEFNSKIIRTLFFYVYREIIFQLIKVIGEFHYILIKPLARIRISLLIFDLKIEIIIEDILEIRYI